MKAAVASFFTRHNFVCHENVNVLTSAIFDDMNNGLAGKKSDEDMIKTYCLPPEKKVVNKSVIVIDAGGTNFRSCLVTFDGNGEASISEMEKTRMPGVEKELSKKEFFAQFASNLDHLKNKADCIGFCFSYPMSITEDGDGILLGFSKEVKAPEVVGSKIGECLKAELESRGWKTINKITMLNDTVAALLAGHAIAPAGKKYSSYIGLILGTGLNAAYIQPAREGIAKQIVVCESGKTKAVTRSDFDIAFDRTTVTPGTFYMEKSCSGAYLGPVALLVIKGAAQDGLFSGALSEKLLALNSLTLIELDQYLHAPEADSTLGSLVKQYAQGDDGEILFELLDAVAERSARRAAAILSACVVQSGAGVDSSAPVCILCNGTTFHKTYKVKDRVLGYLEEVLTVQRDLHWEVVWQDNDITLGTAIAGLI